MPKYELDLTLQCTVALGYADMRVLGSLGTGVLIYIYPLQCALCCCAEGKCFVTVRC